MFLNILARPGISSELSRICRWAIPSPPGETWYSRTRTPYHRVRESRHARGDPVDDGTWDGQINCSALTSPHRFG